MLKIKVIFFSGVIALSSFSCAMESGNGAVVPFNQTGTLAKHGNYTMQVDKGSVGQPIRNQKSQKNIKKPVDQSDTIKILYEAAARDVVMRDFNARRISEDLNKNYVGVGDHYSRWRNTWSELNMHGVYRESSEEIIAELNKICPCSLNRPLINKIVEINWRFWSLLNSVAMKKIDKFWSIGQSDTDPHLTPWAIDNFFDEQFSNAELHSSLQDYVQEKVEDKYKKKFCLSDNDDRDAIKEHAIRNTLKYGIYWLAQPIEWTKALLQSKTLKSLPSDRRNAVKKDICVKIESLCAKSDITYKEGKYCDGDEFKQECK